MSLDFKNDENPTTSFDLWQIRSENDNREFDVEQYFQNQKILLENHDLPSLMQIIQQIHQQNLSELFCVLNSQLVSFVFNEISAFPEDSSNEYISACLNLCIEFTLLKKISNPKSSVFNSIIESFSKYITPNFVKSLCSLFSNSMFAIQSLWLISNTFTRNEKIFQYFLNEKFDFIELLQNLSENEDPKITALCSIILKRLLTFQTYLRFNLSNWIEICKLFLTHDHLYTQLKCLQALSKFYRHYDFQFSLESDESFNQFIIDVIITYFNVDNPLIFGHILLLILSIIETHEYKQNSSTPNTEDFFTPFLSNIPISDILKIAFLSDTSFLQEAASDLFSFIINLDSPLTLSLVTDVIEALFSIINEANFEGKEKMKSSVFHIFKRNDLCQVYKPVLCNGGYLFLCDALNGDSAATKRTIIQIFNRLLVICPTELISLVDDDLFSQLTDIVESDDKSDENISIAAQALLNDLHSLIES